MIASEVKTNNRKRLFLRTLVPHFGQLMLVPSYNGEIE
jgi:hypothetical protein